jgi:hypothetical protein
MNRTDNKNDSHTDPFLEEGIPTSEGDDLQEQEKDSPLKVAIGIISFIVLIGALVAGGVFMVKLYSDILGSGVEFKPKASVPTIGKENKLRPVNRDYMVLELYFPSGNSFEGEQRSVPRASSVRGIARIVIEEFLSGPTGRSKGIIPGKSSLNGLFLGEDSILYIDLSDEFRRNFQGNAMQEYALLKAFNKSIMKNVFQVKGIKLLVDGREVDSVGGHIYVGGLLGDAVSESLMEAREK